MPPGDSRHGEIFTMQVIGWSIAAIGAAVLIGLLLFLILTIHARNKELDRRQTSRALTWTPSNGEETQVQSPRPHFWWGDDGDD